MTLIRRGRGIVGAVLAAAAAVLVAATLSSAQTVGVVRGVVHDAQHRPVPGATVALSAGHADWKQTAVSDANGEFLFAGVPVGDYTLAVTLEGFAPANESVTVVSGTTPIVHLELQVATVSQSVTVTATPEAAQAGAVTPTTMVDRRDIQFTPGADRTNGLEAITAFVPGSYVIHDQLHVRGGHQVSWLVDGVPVPNTSIASSVGPQVDPKDMDYLEALRGSYDAEYGDRTYGVFNVVPRTGFERDNEAEVVASIGSFWQTNDQFSLGGHTERFAYYGSVSGNRSDLGLETPVPQVIHDRQAGVSGFASLIFNATPANQVRLITSVRHDAYQVPNDADAEAAGIDDNEHESDAFVNLSWVRTFASGAVVTVSPFLHWNAANYEGGPTDFPIGTTSRRSSRYAGAQATIARTSQRNEIHAGLYGFAEDDTQAFAVAFNDRSADDFSARETPSGRQLALFAEDKFHASQWLTLTAGVRQTWFSGGVSESATSPRLGATVRVPRVAWMLRGFYGRFYQAPPLATVSGPLLEFVTAADAGFVPLRGERDEEHQVGVTIPVRGWVVDADEFRTRATNFFDHNPIGNSNVFFPLTIDGALIQGWEATVRSPAAWRRAQVHAAYSHQHADGIGGISGGLTDFSTGEGRFPLDHDQRHTFTAGFTATLPRRVFAGANVYYGSGFPQEEGGYLPGHTTLDLMAGKSFGDRCSLALNLLNAANTHVLIDNSLTFGGTHYNNPREAYVELRYRFHY